MSAAHTPGIWEVEPRRFPSQRVRVRAPGCTICQVTVLVHQSANGRLIAAAPDLLAALQALCATFAARPDIRRLFGPKEVAEYDAAREAVIKAEGR